jgi:anti-sigma factor RsiW
MEVTRDIILDLLPLYLAGEASDDSRALIERYLESDPALAKIAEQSAEIDSVEDIPVPLTTEDQMEAYKEAKQQMFWRILALAVVIAFTLLAFLAFAGVVVFMFTSA